MAKGRAVCLLTTALLFGSCAAPSDPRRLEVNSVAVNGTSFRIAAADGRVLHSADLVGAILGVRLHGSEQRIRIDSVRHDQADPMLLFHSISVEQRDGEWRPLCDIAPDGTRAAYPIAGRARADGTLARGGPADFEIVCTAGAQGKCVRLGYRPWARMRDGSMMLSAFNACVRMMRADYAGSGRSMTRDGTRVEVFDTLGIQRSPTTDLAMFEAGWDERGAVCVRHSRVPAIASIGQIEASSRRLAGRVGAMCTPAKARSLGALIFNSSRV
jgi:hypothetical protein